MRQVKNIDELNSQLINLNTRRSFMETNLKQLEDSKAPESDIAKQNNDIIKLGKQITDLQNQIKIINEDQLNKNSESNESLSDYDDPESFVSNGVFGG